MAWLVSLAVLVFERDLGTSLLFFGLFAAIGHRELVSMKVAKSGRRLICFSASICSA